ncbi:MAG: PEGA domain-containing protein [Polyangiaceae bacterium]|nr:PEGA domain-containing protein [Polyangiaceae bacterium]
MRRSLASGSLVVALAVTAAPVVAQPAPPPSQPATPASTEPAQARAKRHFKSGVKLFQDGNFAGALAEFEAAYALEPRGATLQNVALSLKKLFRYAQAAEQLERLVRLHAGELTEEQRRTVDLAIEELRSLVGSVVLRIRPADARVALGGRVVAAAERERPIVLDVGEHALVVEAPGFERVTRTLRVAGGQAGVPVEITLQAVAGFLEVEAHDPAAKIVVDGKERGVHRWRGPVDAGRHAVRVEREGYVAHEQVIEAAIGKTVRVSAPALAQATPAGAAQPPAAREGQRGWYVIGGLDFVRHSEAPGELTHDKSKEVDAVALDLRAGYRVWTPFAVEALMGAGKHDVGDACIGPTCSARQAYRLSAVRIGGNLRLMSAGESLRFVSTVGVGGVRHELVIEESVADGAEPAGRATGIDPFLLVEVGAQMNFGRWLGEAGFALFWDSATSVRREAYAPYDDGSGLLKAGIFLRGGWGEWRPRSRSRR